MFFTSIMAAILDWFILSCYEIAASATWSWTRSLWDQRGL